ncbi:MAG TPA: hypothetical protein VNY25_01730 [Steroidobacteraceae bacterium]|jgi:hypothetical protein|nr:hypothetical protein [Steroidobacteraceae bacterium]
MTSNTNPEHRAQAGTGHFMLTLCRLAAPVSIRPPQSPQLKPFTFFTSHEREPDGSQSLYLHMGYFETLADAERWVEAVHGRFPKAIATVAPAAFLQPPNSAAPSLQPADSWPGISQSSDLAPVEDKSLTDTQVLTILDTRRITPVQHDVDERNCDQIALLRPDDTSTRQALKDAVAQGAPVFFAVQLHWSAQPIDLSRVPSLAIFTAYTLYATESRREGRSRYFLRLGFFGDPISAKQVAVQVRSNFASAAVVPVAEQEVARAREAGMETSSIPYLAQQRVDRALDSNDTPVSPTESKPLSAIPRRVSRGAETLMQTLKRLADREMWTDPDSLSESGVRHLRVDVQERPPGRS